MTEGITQEQREKYILLKDEYHEKKKELGAKIEIHNQEIEKHKSEISNLEKSLKRPILEECNKIMICERCDIKSMKWEWYQPGQGEHINWYKCVICGHEDYCT